MRPDPGVVKQWFAGAVVPEDVLASYISILRSDHNWRLTDMSGATVRTLRLLYFPAGVPFDVVLERTADGWLPRVS